MAEAGTSDTPEHQVPEGTTTQAVWMAASGDELRYTAEARWTALRDEHDSPIADVFSVSYLAGHAGPGHHGPGRPVTFVFNGGPGASSAYLHVGALGPRRVGFDEQGSALAPPTALVDNTESWLPFTDLVFVDPVGTGWSRAASDRSPGSPAPPAGTTEAGDTGASPSGGSDPKAFFGINKDLDSLIEVMTRWLSAHDRWSSPVYVAGESYGGFRAAKLARLANERGIGLTGTILISPALELALLDPSDYDVLPWVDLVPTMALAAHHHGRSRAHAAGASSATVRASAEQFATGPYARALIRGAAMPAEEREQVVNRLAELIGLDREVVGRHECRVSATRFARELLRDQGAVVGLYDAAAVGRDPFPDRDGMSWPDPTLGGIERVFNAGINARLRTELGVKTDREYRLLSMAVNKDWKVDFERHALETQVGATDDLRYGMALNPHMRVFVSHGIYDMVTPYFASERIRNLLRLDERTAEALTVQHFDGGHMFYAWERSRIAFTQAITAFYGVSGTSARRR